MTLWSTLYSLDFEAESSNPKPISWAKALLQGKVILWLPRSNSHLLGLDLESHRSGAFVAQTGAPTIRYRDLDTVSMQHVRIPCRHRWNPMPTHCCTNLLLFLFQSMKSNSKKILRRILHSACPGQELHKCLDRQCLATTFWNIVKHARMSSAWLFLCMFIVFLYMDGCNYLVQAAAVLWDFLPLLCISSEKQ